MTWAQARSALRALLVGLGHPVFTIPPATVDERGEVIMLVPPARDVERRASGVTRTVYHQRIAVMAHIAAGSKEELDAVGTGVDNVVEEINVALGGALSLDGDAVVLAPPTWDEMTVDEYPEGSGTPYARMVGTVDIEVERIGTFTA